MKKEGSVSTEIILNKHLLEIRLMSREALEKAYINCLKASLMKTQLINFLQKSKREKEVSA